MPARKVLAALNCSIGDDLAEMSDEELAELAASLEDDRDDPEA